MKKKLLILSILPLFSFAQTVIWSEDFNGDINWDGWEVYDEDGDKNGYLVNNHINEGIIVLESYSYLNGSPLTPDNYIVIPPIDLTNASGTITLKWKIAAPDEDFDAENYTVYVATANDVASLKSSETYFNESTLDGVNTLTERTLDISSFAGESTVYAAFRHHDVTDQFSIRIDDISIEAEKVLSVDDTNSLAKTLIYPNPTKESFALKLGNKYNNKNTIMKLTDLSGRVVKTFRYGENYDISSLSRGVYVVTITDGKQTESQKLIKE